MAVAVRSSDRQTAPVLAGSSVPVNMWYASSRRSAPVRWIQTDTLRPRHGILELGGQPVAESVSPRWDLDGLQPEALGQRTDVLFGLTR